MESQKKEIDAKAKSEEFLQKEIDKWKEETKKMELKLQEMNSTHADEVLKLKN